MATRKALTNNALKAQPEPNIYTVGLDVGYGVTKAVMDNHDPVIFPSVTAYSREIKFQADEIAVKYPGDQLMDDEGTWFVGELAMSQARPAELLRLRGRTANESSLGNVFRARLAKVALGKLFAGVQDGSAIHIRIATGLPVDHMRDSAELKAALVGQHLIQTDNAEFVANITHVMVMPQPYGTIYSKMLKPNGVIDPCHTAKRTGVVDVGTYTVDLALDDDGEYVDAMSGSTESGVHMAQERIASAIERDYREKPSYRMVENILRTGCLRAHGQTVDYREQVNHAIDPIRSAALALISEKWQTGLGVDVIYLSGGGAELVARQVKEVYKQTILLDDSQTANARGYLAYANFTARG
ncbi:MAG: ParM/StbA family protein [Anaerolineae bacterium]|nr:ParM/StbA family protein [Anaerolineae bacterium]